MAKKKIKEEPEKLEIEEYDGDELSDLEEVEEALEELEEEYDEDELSDLEEVEEALEELEEEAEEVLDEEVEDIIEIRTCGFCKKEFKCSKLYSETQIEIRDIEQDEVLCHQCDLSFIDKIETKEEYEKSEYNKQEQLETNSIKEKLKIIAYPDKKSTNSPDLIKSAQIHLEFIKQVEYNYSMAEYFKYLAGYYGKNTKIIKKSIYIPLIIIKDYWKMYDINVEEEKLRKQMLEQIDKLDATQLSEVSLDALKKIVGGNIKKSNKEYLIDLMIKHKINLFKGNVKE